MKFGFVVISLSVIFYYKASYYLQSYDHLIKGTRKYNLWYPYYSIFDPVEDVDREKLYIDSMRESFNSEESND
jgi:hypothetical protein